MKTGLFKYIENFTTKWNFSDKISDIFHISAQNIDCGCSLELSQWGSSNKYPQSMFLDCMCSLEPPHWGSSNKYPQSLFLSRNKKTNVYPVNPSFTI